MYTQYIYIHILTDINFCYIVWDCPDKLYMPITYSDAVKPHSLQVPFPSFSVKTILTLAIKCDLAKMVNKFCGSFPLVCQRNLIYSRFKYFITLALGFRWFGAVFCSSCLRLWCKPVAKNCHQSSKVLKFMQNSWQSFKILFRWLTFLRQLQYIWPNYDSEKTHMRNRFL